MSIIMTDLTPEKLDAQILHLRDQANKLAALWPDQAADTITSLRSALAEARVERDVHKRIAIEHIKAGFEKASETDVLIAAAEQAGYGRGLKEMGMSCKDEGCPHFGSKHSHPEVPTAAQKTTDGVSHWVFIDGRRFRVTLDTDGKPLTIKERVKYAPGTAWEGLSDRSVWHHKHHAIPKRSTSLYARVIKAAQDACP